MMGQVKQQKELIDYRRNTAANTDSFAISADSSHNFSEVIDLNADSLDYYSSIEEHKSEVGYQRQFTFIHRHSDSKNFTATMTVGQSEHPEVHWDGLPMLLARDMKDQFSVHD